MSGFICGVNEVFAVVGCCATWMVSQLRVFGKSVGPEVAVTNH